MCDTKDCKGESLYWVQTLFPRDMPKREIVVCGHREQVAWAANAMACGRHLASTVESLSVFHDDAMRTVGRERWYYPGPRLSVKVRAGTKRRRYWR